MEKKYLKLELEKAQEAYKSGDKALKQFLIDCHGRENFLLNVKDRVIDYASACEEIGIKPLTIDYFDFLPEEDRERTFARHQITVGVRALVGDWVPDFKDGSWKYYTYGYEDKNGLSLFGCSCIFSCYVGSDLLFPNADLRDYAQTIFKKQYIKYLFNR